MLAVHWSPVKNTRRILREGISKSKDGVFCFPLTGNPYVDKFWARAFRHWRPRTQYNGFVFRVTDDDMPACFSHWLHGVKAKPLQSVAQIRADWEETILFRIGQRHFGYSLDAGQHHDEYIPIGRRLIEKNPDLYVKTLDSDPNFLAYIFEDYQLVLSRSVAPKRIEHILAGGSDFGRNIARFRREQWYKTQARNLES